MTERARDKDGKRQEREGERQQVETHRGPQAGGTERQVEREREAETQREREREKGSGQTKDKGDVGNRSAKDEEETEMVRDRQT